MPNTENLKIPAGPDEGASAEITLRGLFMLLTASVRSLFDAKYLPEDTRKVPRLNPQIKAADRTKMGR